MISPRRIQAVTLAALLGTALACGTPQTTLTGPSPAPAPATPAPPGPSGEPVQFAGLVTGVTGACPSLIFQAAGRRTTTDGSTSYLSGACADVRRGALLSVEGRELDGVVASARVRIESDGPADPGLLTDVAAGGYVLFFRHAERDASAISTGALAIADNAGECLPGSELTARGRADAEALGERFRRYGIAVQKVVSSPTCRTTEMARLAFGDFETTRALLWRDVWAAEEVDTLNPVLRRLLSTPPEPGKTIVLLSHNEILNKDPFDLEDLVLEQAEAAVFRPLGNSYELVGRIPKSLWLGRR